MSEVDHTEKNALQNVYRSRPNSEFEPRVSRQEAVGEQNKNYNTPLTTLLEDWSRLLQGMIQTHAVSFSPYGQYQCKHWHTNLMAVGSVEMKIPEYQKKILFYAPNI